MTAICILIGFAAFVVACMILGSAELDELMRPVRKDEIGPDQPNPRGGLR